MFVSDLPRLGFGEEDNETNGMRGPRPGSVQDRRKCGRMSRSTCREELFVIYFSSMAQLSHVDDQGRVRMVDTGSKEITRRRAVASARVLMIKETVVRA